VVPNPSFRRTLAQKRCCQMLLLVIWVVTPWELVGGLPVFQRVYVTISIFMDALHCWRWRQYVLWNISVYLQVHISSQPRKSSISSCSWEPQTHRSCQMLRITMMTSTQDCGLSHNSQKFYDFAR
jgi:hypothetical protein